MDTDNLDGLFGNEPTENEVHNTEEQTQVEVTEVTETVEEPTETEASTEAETEQVEAPERQRDEKGRFVSQQRPTIPVEALIEERNRRQAEAHRAAELERRLGEYEAQQRNAQRPDPFENQHEFHGYDQQQIQQGVHQSLMQKEQQAHLENFHSSHVRASETHGDEAVRAALDWAAQRGQYDEMWARHALSQRDPVSWIVEQQNRHAQFDEFVRDPDGFKARIAAEMGMGTAVSAAPANTTQMAAKSNRVKSIASVGSGNATGKPTAQNSTEAFNAIFDSKG